MAWIKYANSHYNVLKNSEKWDIMEKFIVTPREDKTVTMTIRIDRALQERYNDLSARTNRSRNELIGMALQYALDHMELREDRWRRKTPLPHVTTGKDAPLPFQIMVADALFSKFFVKMPDKV